MKKNNYLFTASVISVIVLGALLRLVKLNAESLRLDEAQSIWQASHSLEFIRWYMVQNVHLPLHNSLLHVWMRVFGNSETAVRLMSTIPGVLTLPALYFLAMEILGARKKALIALTMGALSPFWIWYSREIRMYTLLTLFSTLSYYLFLRILKKPSFKLFAIYTLVNAGGVYIHYFFNFVLLVQGIFFLAAWKSGWFESMVVRGKRLFASFVVSAVVLLIIFLPWLVYYFKNHNQGGVFYPSLDKPDSFNLVLSMFEFILGYQPEWLTSALIALWPLSILIGFIFLTKRKDPLTPKILLTVLGALLPIALVYIISLVYRPIYLTRYLMTSTPLFIVLVTWVLVEMKGYFKTYLTGLFFVIVLLSLYSQRFNKDNPSKENYREAVAYLREHAGPRDIIVVNPPYTLYPVYYYYDGPSRLISMPIWDKSQISIPQINQISLEEESTYIQQGHKRIFLVSTLDLKGSYEIQRYMDYNYRRLSEKQFSKFIWVGVYQAEYPEVPDSQQATL